MSVREFPWTEKQERAELSIFFRRAREAMNIKGGFSKEWDLNYNCHEIAHWLLADPTRRSLCCFGLLRVYQGAAEEDRVKGHESDCKLVVSCGQAELEECLASLLGIGLMSLVDVEGAWIVLEDDSWIDGPQTIYDKRQWSDKDGPPVQYIQRLKDRNLWPPRTALQTLEEEMKNAKVSIVC